MWTTTKVWRPPPIQFLWLVVVILVFLAHVDARSPHPAPLRRVTTATSHLSILPRKPPNGLIPRYASLLPPPPSTLKHSDSLVLTLDLPNLLPFEVKLFVKPSEHMFHPDARIKHGQEVIGELREEDWRLYTGDVVHPGYIDRLTSLHAIGAHQPSSDRSQIHGRASVMVHHPGNLDGHDAVWEGSFTVGGELYNVMTRENYERVKTREDVTVEGVGRMVIFRQSDMRHDQGTNQTTTIIPSCSHDSLAFNHPSNNPLFTTHATPSFSFLNPLGMFWKRSDTGGMTGSSNYINSINDTTGCPDTQQIVYMGVALDCNYVATYGSPDAARTQVLNNWNQVSALYKSSFKISLGLIELQVQNMTCPPTPVSGEEWNVGCEANVTLDTRLGDFSAWRGAKGDDGAGLWHLMSACPTDSEVGVAWLGTLCQTDSSQQASGTVSGTGISTASKTEWSLIAHEIGHGFGAIHDCTSGCSLSGACCPLTANTCNANGQFIMNPTTSTTEQTFSAWQRTVISLQQCGNGIVEDGEDCDPGANTTSTCCDSSTCKFTSGAVCDPTSSTCCTSFCQYSPANTTCRGAVNDICDYPEYCTGTSAECPEDKMAKDGTSCGSDGLACASGTCTSLDKQCTTAGLTMGLSKACGQRDDTSCVVACKDPNSTNSCVVLQTPLVDGSPCGYGGHCYNQTCESGSWQDTAAAWYKQNLQISIPVTIVVGLIVLAILFFIVRCIYRSCTRRGKSAGTGGGAAARKTKYVPANRDPYHRGPPLPPPPPSLSTRAMQMSGVAAPQPALQKSFESRASVEPLMAGSGVGRPNSEYDQGPGYPAGQWYSQGYGDTRHGYEGDGYGGQGYEYQAPQYSASSFVTGTGGREGGGVYSQMSGWVDDRTWNGQYYGQQEAYGR
ncbi:hypothetical protein I312_106190 [Cryptococcus bacillisporus CA1280]|uniref:uncharacterized protein n=1 Tax=Cryptococcus bacillisporus CA1280 TaxID=1296109 RepID=UPI003366AA9A